MQCVAVWEAPASMRLQTRGRGRASRLSFHPCPFPAISIPPESIAVSCAPTRQFSALAFATEPSLKTVRVVRQPVYRGLCLTPPALARSNDVCQRPEFPAACDDCSPGLDAGPG